MKIAAVTPKIHLGDCAYNADKIIEYARECYRRGCSVAAFPAYAITGSTCGDLFFQKTLRDNVDRALRKIHDASVDFGGMLIAVGFPRIVRGLQEAGDHRGSPQRSQGVSSSIALIKDGDYLGFISNHFDPKYIDDTFTETDGAKRQFFFDDEFPPILHDGLKLSFMTDVIDFDMSESFEAGKPDVAIWLCNRELFAGSVFSDLNLIADPLSGGEPMYEEPDTVKYIAVSSGPGESTDEAVYSGLKAYCAYGKADYSLKPGICVFDTDEEPGNTFGETRMRAAFDRPDLSGSFLPEDDEAKEAACLDILKIQATALGERLKFLGMGKCVIGLSGGLDSTLALIAAVCAYRRYGLDLRDIICVTMPGFGTGSTTKGNAHRLAGIFGVTLKEIDIKEQVSLHLHSIGQPVDGNGFVGDVTFENAQARARTMILMDIANMENAIVVGTGDMSELALGWCTYNGDHMSMYSVNAGVPKTVIPHVIRTFAGCVALRGERDEVGDILESIIETPVSPELLPLSDEGEVVQKTEDSLGPYELHDQFLYYLLFGSEWCDLDDIFELTVEKFYERYDREVVGETFRTFVKRYFTQQFKRSCLPVGVKVFEYSLSPRSGFLLPSDACVDEWMREIG